MTHKIYFGICIILIMSCVSSKKINYPQNEFWTFISSKEIDSSKNLPIEYLTLKLNMNLLESRLKESNAPEITLPFIDQTFIKVKLEDSGTMSPELSAKFPNIKSFKGVEVGNSSTKLRIDKNVSGLFAMIIKEGNTYFLNPIEKRSSVYIIYDKQHAIKGGNPFIDKTTN